MSTVEQIERAEERRKRRVAFLFLAALLILLLGLVGRSWFVDPVEGETAVLSQTQERSARGPGATPPSVSGGGNAVTAGNPDADGTDHGEVADGGPPTAGSTAVASGASGSSATSGNPNQGNQGNDGSQGNAGGPGGNPGSGVGGGPGTNPPTTGPQTFGISGEVADLYPGFVGDLHLTLTNPHRFRIVVTDLAVRVGTPTINGTPVPSCAGYLTVDPWQGSRTIATLGSAPQSVTARFSADATDACQSVTYPLTYGGTAIRENQS